VDTKAKQARAIRLQLVVNNVTNKRPPFAYKASTSGSGGSAFWGLVDSPIQRPDIVDDHQDL